MSIKNSDFMLLFFVCFFSMYLVKWS